jgi:hypothetical protein
MRISVAMILPDCSRNTDSTVDFASMEIVGQAILPAAAFQAAPLGGSPWPIAG